MQLHLRKLQLPSSRHRHCLLSVTCTAWWVAMACHGFPAPSHSSHPSHPSYPGFQAIFLLNIHFAALTKFTKHSLHLFVSHKSRLAAPPPALSNVQISLAWISLWIIELPQCGGAASAKEWNICCTWKAAQLHKKNPGLRLHRKRMEKAVALVFSAALVLL